MISAKGSSSSHVAILARAMGVPTVMGVSDIPTYGLQGKAIIIDGYYGQIYVEPSPALRAQFEQLAEEERELAASLETFRDQPAQTKDGARIALMVNAGLGGADVSFVAGCGC